MDEDETHLRAAILKAREAERDGEVPVGAVVLHRGRIIATGQNRVIRDADPTAHAEIVAIRAAGRALGNYRLTGCTLYTTLEPCAMCAGAILHARLERLVYAADDPKAGACGSVLSVLNHPALNHRLVVTRGVLAAECGAMLSSFFRARRRIASLETKLTANETREPRIQSHEPAPDILPETPPMATRKWSAKVDTDETHPDHGLFLEDAESIAKALATPKVSPKGPASGMRMLTFYMNRAGKNLSEERVKELDKAKEILSGIIAAQKPVTKKPPAAGSTAEKVPAKKTSAKKSVAKKVAAKRSSVSKSASKPSPAPAKKSVKTATSHKAS